MLGWHSEQLEKNYETMRSVYIEVQYILFLSIAHIEMLYFTLNHKHVEIINLTSLLTNTIYHKTQAPLSKSMT